MCGICGMINWDKSIDQIENFLGAMCDVIRHRGPDEEGLFIEKNVALGMRRLKIIDLSTGSQPIYNEDRSIVIVFNGEIYNYLDLKEGLLKKGHLFYTETDTEVIVHLYEDYGEECFSYLNGMFGIAIWDKKGEKLILARDRMGEKPLHYTQIGDTFLFGSEIKSILCYPKIAKEIEMEAVYHYFTFNHVPSPLTIYKNIFKLEPAEYLVFQNCNLTKQKYWDAQFQTSGYLNENQIKERLYPALSKAVKYRLISDVPLGAFLSGGIDSSIMVAIMSEVSNSSVKTFSIGLEDERESELPFARAVADRYETEHHELIAKPDATDLLDQIVWQFDEPFADASALPTFLVSYLTRKYVTVAISGDGGDELFGGYERYRRILKRRYIENLPKNLRKFLSSFVGASLPFGFTAKAFLQSLQYDNYRFFTTGASKEMKKAMLNHLFSEMDSYKVAQKHLLANQTLLNRCMFYDMKVYLPGDILTKVDRMSMANSLETRAPFLDHFLVEFAMRIPEELKIQGGITKYIIKKIFKKHLPESVYSHKKTGFSIPIGRWFRNELRPLVMETVSQNRIAQSGMLNWAFVDRVLKQHMSGRKNHAKLIWMILMLQLWYDNWFVKSHPKLENALKRRLKR